jgi:UDP-N-acetylglucosamine:LPS N-acetylglucosamine transferase
LQEQPQHLLRALGFEPNFGAIAGLIVAVVRATALITRWRPAVVLSVGGYAGLPAAVGAVTRAGRVLEEPM